MVADEKTGLSAPLLMVNLLKVASVDGALVTVIITVLVVTPSCAVITVVITLGPTDNAMFPEGVPDVTAMPFTVIVAVGSFAAAITCTDDSLENTFDLKLT